MSSLAPSIGPRGGAGWRTRDVVVTAVLGAAFGVVFWAWGNLVWPATAFLGPLQNLLYGPWLIPAVLGPLGRAAVPAPASSPRSWQRPSPPSSARSGA